MGSNPMDKALFNVRRVTRRAPLSSAWLTISSPPNR